MLLGPSVGEGQKSVAPWAGDRRIDAKADEGVALRVSEWCNDDGRKHDGAYQSEDEMLQRAVKLLLVESLGRGAHHELPFMPRPLSFTKPLPNEEPGIHET